MTKVSIAIPVYGVEKYIERCAISLLEQTYSDIEYIFVNDCTRDKSIDILKGCISKYPKRYKQIKIIEHSINKGLASARNTAIENSTGDFIIHVDADDYVDVNFVEELLSKQQETDADIVTCSCKKVYNDKVLLLNTKYYDDVYTNIINVLALNTSHNIWGKLIRMSLYKANHIRNIEGINNTEDLQVLPMLLYFANSYSTTSSTCYYYDCSNENSYTNVPKVSSSMQSWETFNILNSFFKDKGDEYLYSLKIGEIKNLAMQMTRWSKYPEYKDYYNSLIVRLNGVDKHFYHYVPLIYRPVILMQKQLLVSTYVRLMHGLKEFFLRFKSLYE